MAPDGFVFENGQPPEQQRVLAVQALGQYAQVCIIAVA